MNTRRWVHSGIATAMLFAATDASAIYIRADRSATPHEQLAALFPATGYFGDSSFGQFCTGTLVSPTQVLIAAHCVDANSNGNPDDSIGSLVFGLEPNVPNSLNANIASIAINPGWVSSNGDAAFDFAVLTLDTPITNVAPALITSQNPVGQLGAAVGYGNQGTGTSHSDPPGSDDKLAVTNLIERFGDDPYFSNNNTLQFDFDSPNLNTNTFGNASPLDLEGATAPGDSGSPLMAQFGDTWFVTGVLNTGYNDFGNWWENTESQYGDVSIYAAVQTPTNLAWLASQGLRIIDDTAPVLGDANRDWFVDQNDLDMVIANWGQSPTAGTGADVNGDGFVGLADLEVLLAQWGEGTPFPGVALVAIPEPTSLALLGLGLLAIRRRRA